MPIRTTDRIASYLADLSVSSPATQTGKIWAACAKIADALAVDDPAFDRDRFLRVCGFGAV